MIYLDLFLGFFHVGCFSFGGAYGAIPLIRDMVLSYNWLTDEMLTYMIAISESTPGPIMVNLATYIGNSQAGILGATIATFAVVLPAFIIILLIMIVLNNLLKNKYMQAILNGLKPCMIGIILATGVSLILHNIVVFKSELSFDRRATFLTLILFIIIYTSKLLFKKNLSPIMLILIAAFLGITTYGI